MPCYITELKFPNATDRGQYFMSGLIAVQMKCVRDCARESHDKRRLS